jgi:flotillin
VAANVAQGLELSGSLTGVDIKALLNRLGGKVAESANADGSPSKNGRPEPIEVRDHSA